MDVKDINVGEKYRIIESQYATISIGDIVECVKVRIQSGRFLSGCFMSKANRDFKKLFPDGLFFFPEWIEPIVAESGFITYHGSPVPVYIAADDNALYTLDKKQALHVDSIERAEWIVKSYNHPVGWVLEE